MLKKIGIGVLVLALLVGGGLLYMNHRNRTLSPPAVAQFNNDDLVLSVAYSRPSVRERLIFGKEEDNALVPYDQYWRLGANEATEITTNTKITLGGKEVSAGTYRIYAIPHANDFTIGVNSELGQWGYSEPNYELDLFQVKAPVQKLEKFVHQFTMSFEETPIGVVLHCDWANTRVNIFIEKA